MKKTYDPEALEQRLYAFWEKNGYFAPHGKGAAYCIMIPPPNVTGNLHMGHGFQQTLMDILVRYQRMAGRNTLWQVGTDHAGISTQMVVERQLAQANQSRHDLGREKFVERVWQWRQTLGQHITHQLRHLGLSVDWSREHFTLDADLSKAVQAVFIKLYDEGLIYRGKKLVNWDPSFLSAISDLEVNSVEEDGHLWHIRYPLVDAPTSYVTIATTRPETLLGDAAVAVNPKDARYQHLIGKMLKLPLTDRSIPIIADDYVDPDFGSGCVKITPAHDFNDYEVGLRHDLAQINIFTPDAKINQHAPAAYQGMDRFATRTQIIQDLEQQGLLAKTEDHTLKVPRNDRGGCIIEPYLTDQWFVKAKPLAEPAIAAVRQGQIKFIPENWNKTYYQWMHNIQDWCISRQLWWGHRIPVWYDAQNNIYVGQSEADVRVKYRLAADIPLRQDEDVLDTWFSSALWPFATLGWPHKTPEFDTFYPTDVLVTGFDILFFWVARMIMLGLKFTGKTPFHTVYIHGLIRDSEGQKMSKTKGNVLDPLDLIHGIALEPLVAKRTQNLLQTSQTKTIAAQTRKEFPNGIPAFGTDALRFTFAALASTGRNIRFDLARLEGYRNFCNKLWNATRYVLMNLEDDDAIIAESNPEKLGLADRWIQSRLQHVIQATHQHLAAYRFDLLAQTLYDFTWHEFCDWYLELSKPILLGQSSASQKQATLHTLVNTLDVILRLLHPIVPFITEELWQQLKPHIADTNDSIMLAAYPVANPKLIDQTVEAEIDWLQQFILGIRHIRGEMNIPPQQKLPMLLHKGNLQDRENVQKNHDLLIQLTKLACIDWLDENAPVPASATTLIGELELLIPLAGLIDKDAELQRLEKALAKLDKELQRSQAKLNNFNYVNKAPANVVNQERQRVDEMQKAQTKLQQKYTEIKKL